MKKIKIELELDPTDAFALGALVHQSAQGVDAFYKLLSKKGKDELMKIGQEIIDQVSTKTDFEQLKNKHS